jgi:hypothetical protein
MEFTPTNEEKSSLGHDEEAAIALSPIKSQVGTRKDSIETVSASKLKDIVEIQ